MKLLLPLLVLLTSVFAQEISIPRTLVPSPTIERWNGLVGIVQNITDDTCFAHLSYTFKEADTILNHSGVDLSFLSFLDGLRTVAGDIPDTSIFIQVLNGVQKEFKKLYDDAGAAAFVEVGDRTAGAFQPALFGASFVISIVGVMLLY